VDGIERTAYRDGAAAHGLESVSPPTEMLSFDLKKVNVSPVVSRQAPWIVARMLTGTPPRPEMR
jgi:hypothetical protein